MKISEHFLVQEFLTPNQYKAFSKNPTKEAFYKLIHPSVVELAEFYRDFFDAPVIINNWHVGGTYTLRGLRPKNCDIGAKFSMHKVGKAFDCDIKGLTAEQVRDIIESNQELFYKKGLRRIENNVSWLHSDIKETNLTNKILFFNP